MIIDLDPYCVSQAEFDDETNETFTAIKDCIRGSDAHTSIINMSAAINKFIKCDIILSTKTKLTIPRHACSYWVCKFDIPEKYTVYLTFTEGHWFHDYIMDTCINLVMMTDVSDYYKKNEIIDFAEDTASYACLLATLARSPDSYVLK
jgi:hypothetical protein